MYYQCPAFTSADSLDKTVENPVLGTATMEQLPAVCHS